MMEESFWAERRRCYLFEGNPIRNMKNLFTNPHGNENVINEIAVKGTSLHNYQHFKSMLNNVFFFSLLCWCGYYKRHSNEWNSLNLKYFSHHALRITIHWILEKSEHCWHLQRKQSCVKCINVIYCWERKREGEWKVTLAAVVCMT